MTTRSALFELLSLSMVLLVAASAAKSATIPTGFVSEHVVGPPFVGVPVGFAFIPDGRFLIIEQNTGRVDIAPVGSLTSTHILTIPDVTFGGERGLLAVCVDPDWPARPYVYFFYTHTGNVSYLTMYTAAGDLTDPESVNVTLGSPYILLNGISDAVNFHNGGTIRFGTDGMLLLSFGDDGGACGAQNVDFPLGKLYRLDVSAMPGVGPGPPPRAALVAPGHPYDSSDYARFVAAWGLRNPFRFTVDQETGTVVLGDVGLDTQEEIDLMPPASLGANFGWPQLEGTHNPMCCGSCGIGNIFTAPIYTYPHDGGLKSVIGGPMIRQPAGATDPFPAEYVGDIFLAEYYSGWIRRLKESGGTWSVAPLVPGQPSAENWAEGITYISDMQLGADGCVYYMRMLGDTPGLNRIRSTPPLDADVLDAASRNGLVAEPTPARVGDTVRLHWSTSFASPARMTIQDVAGRTVRELGVNLSSSGAILWDGRDAGGGRLSAGAYFARLDAGGGRTLTAKIVLIR